MLAGVCVHGTSNCLTGERNSWRTARPPANTAYADNDTASHGGTPLRHTAHTASATNTLNAQINQREGRHSSRQGANIGDECGVGGIGASLVSHEPAPQLIVFAIQ